MRKKKRMIQMRDKIKSQKNNFKATLSDKL